MSLLPTAKSQPKPSLADLTVLAFDLADKYRNPVMILGDGMTGQMMEPVAFGKPRPRRYNEKYTLQGAGDGKSKFIRALILDALRMEEHNWKLVRKYRVIEQSEVRFETYKTGNARLIIVAYGIAARIAKGAISRLRDLGMKVGLIRPITLWPFPAQIIRDTAERIDRFLVFEMSTGQMLDEESGLHYKRARMYDAALGQFLADDKGMTLYVYTKDTPNTSNCYNACATAWPRSRSSSWTPSSPRAPTPARPASSGWGSAGPRTW